MILEADIFSFSVLENCSSPSNLLVDSAEITKIVSLSCLIHFLHESKQADWRWLIFFILYRSRLVIRQEIVKDCLDKLLPLPNTSEEDTNIKWILEAKDSSLFQWLKLFILNKCRNKFRWDKIGDNKWISDFQISIIKLFIIILRLMKSLNFITFFSYFHSKEFIAAWFSVKISFRKGIRFQYSRSVKFRR